MDHYHSSYAYNCVIFAWFTQTCCNSTNFKTTRNPHNLREKRKQQVSVSVHCKRIITVAQNKANMPQFICYLTFFVSNNSGTEIFIEKNVQWWHNTLSQQRLMKNKKECIKIENGKCFQISNSNYTSHNVMSHRRIQLLQLVS